MINASSLLSRFALNASIAAQKGNEKIVKCKFFSLEIQYKTMNHCGHCSLANID
jgi:hypothetical protein